MKEQPRFNVKGNGRRVYVAGPINGSGKQHSNAHNAMLVANYLWSHGFVPFVPHMFWLYHYLFPSTTEQMALQWCDSWLSACDFLVRLPGESPGSDHEVATAKKLGIPVFEVVLPSDTDPFTPARLMLMNCEKYDVDGASPKGYDAVPWSLKDVLNDFQSNVGRWIEAQPFADQKAHQPLLGMGEELGELMHAHLKSEQGIRGFADQDKTNAAKADAVGDILVYAAGYCKANGLQLGSCVQAVWDEVKKRDWNKNKANGSTDQPSPYSSNGPKTV